MAHEVFVSYSTADKPVADAVCATLERHGVRCWIAPRDILPGLDWGAAIVDAIGASKVMVLVFSAAANKSPQIKREVERAVHKGVAIIPLRIEDVPLGKTLEYFISSSHWLDAYTPSVEAHLDRARRDGQAPARPPEPRERDGRLGVPAVDLRSRDPARGSRAKPSGVSTRALGVVAVAALLAGGGAFLATRGHSPRIESIEFPPTIVQGQQGNGVLHFTDKKGDAALVKFEPVQGASFRPWTMELEGMTGRTSGSYAFWLSSPLIEHIVLEATLVDNGGKKSAPVASDSTFARPRRTAAEGDAARRQEVLRDPGAQRLQVQGELTADAAGCAAEEKRRPAVDYRPAPRDTSGVRLPPDIVELTELLARNTHENWARQRLADGWRYGPKRDDAKKEHPSLVPYESLSESEKEYDRRTAMETLKTIVALGYRIAKAAPTR